MTRLRDASVFVAIAAAPTVATASEGGGIADLLWPTLNLVLLLALLFVVARKPLREWFADRRVRIQEDLERATTLRSEAEKRYARWQRQLVDLDAELERIRKTASERAETEREQILADAQGAAERIRSDARVAIEHEVRRARAQLRDEASQLAIELASGMLEHDITETDRTRLLDEFIDTVESSGQPAAAAS